MSKVIMLASGKGGTGKSTMSVLIGTALCYHKKSVLLIELDAGLRSIDIISGVSSETVYDLNDVLTGTCPIENAIVKSTDRKGLDIISAPYSDGVISINGLGQLLDKVIDCYDYIIIDTAAGLGAPFIAAASVSNLALVVVTPDPISVRDGRIVVEELLKLGLESTRLLINKVLLPRQGKNPINDLDYCIDEIGAQLIGVVPNSPEIYFCSCEGMPLLTDTVEFEIFHRIAGRLDGVYSPLIFETR